VTAVGIVTPEFGWLLHGERVMTGAVVLGVVGVTWIGVSWLIVGVGDVVATGDNGGRTRMNGIRAGGKLVGILADLGVTNLVCSVLVRRVFCANSDRGAY
jgi:hypothetical protein